MKTCSIPTCGRDSNRYPQLAFFNLPRHSNVREEWLDVIGMKRSSVWSGHIKVCETHFRPKDFCAGKKQLKTHAIPVFQIGSGKADPVNSDDEFMQCDSESDPEIIEVKELSIMKKNVQQPAKKIKKEPEKPEEPQKEVEEPAYNMSRRPSRRAAQVAAKKISHTVRNLSLLGVSSDQTNPKSQAAGRGQGYQRGSNRRIRQGSKEWHSLKLPPADIDLLMECHEELLSAVQAEYLLKAQSEYNLVMKTLRTLKAQNVRIICTAGDEPEPEISLLSHSSLTVSAVKKNSRSKSPPVKQQNIITMTPIGSPVPTKLFTAFAPKDPSSPAPILS